MADFDVRAAVEVGDGAGHLEDAVVGAGGKAKTVHRLFQQHLPRLVNPAVFAHHPAAHLRVGEQPVTTLETLFLDFPRLHPLSDVRREIYFDSTIYLPPISVYFLILLSKLSILSVDRTINFVIISFRV